MQHLCNIFVLDFLAILERKGREGMLPVWKCCQLSVANSQLETGHWALETGNTGNIRSPRLLRPLRSNPSARGRHKGEWDALARRGDGEGQRFARGGVGRRSDTARRK